MSAVVVETRDLPECCTTQLVQTCCATLHGHTNRLTAHATVGVVASKSIWWKSCSYDCEIKLSPSPATRIAAGSPCSVVNQLRMKHSSGDQTRPTHANDSLETIRDSFRMPLLSAHRNHEHDADVDPPSEQKQKVWEHCLCTAPLHWARIYPMFAGQLQRSRRCIASKNLD